MGKGGGEKGGAADLIPVLLLERMVQGSGTCWFFRHVAGWPEPSNAVPAWAV